MNRQRTWRTALAAGSLLLLGAAVGVTADRLLHRPAATEHLLADMHRDPIATLEEVLDLRPEQRERVAVILATHQAGIDAVWHDTHTRIQATVDSVVNEMAAVLDQDQARRFRALVEQMHNPRSVSHPHN